MLKLPSNSRVIFTGFTGSGKTIRALWLASKWVSIKKHIFISDPLNAWNGWGPACWDAQEAAQRVMQGEKIIRLYSHSSDDIEELFVLAQKAPDSLLVVDESSGMFSSRLDSQHEAYVRFVNHGRHYNQTLIQLAQHFAAIPAGLRTQSYVFTSAMPEGTALTWLRQRIGGRLPPSIPLHHWLVVAPSGEWEILDPLPESEVRSLMRGPSGEAGTYFEKDEEPEVDDVESIPVGKNGAGPTFMGHNRIREYNDET